MRKNCLTMTVILTGLLWCNNGLCFSNIDNHNSIITDTETGLMWKRCPEGLSGKNCEKGEVKEYNYDDAVQRFKNVDYAGYSDWRMPTIDELKTLVYCSNEVKYKKSGKCNDGSEKPTIDQQVFPNNPRWFWSKSSDTDYSTLAWGVFFNDGSSYTDYRNAGNAVRLVRSGQSPKNSPQGNPDPGTAGKTTIGKYTDNHDGTIKDTTTGLMWKRCPEGLSGKNCEEGKIKISIGYDAIKRFKNIEYAGYSDWRLPTIDELKTLLYCSKGKDDEGDCNKGSEKPTINQQAFPNTTTDIYYSGSPDAIVPGFAWVVGFDIGISGTLHSGNGYAVRLVRNGQ